MNRGRHARHRWWHRLWPQADEPEPEEAEDEYWSEDEWPALVAFLNRQMRRPTPLELLPVSEELIPFRRNPYPGSPR